MRHFLLDDEDLDREEVVDARGQALRRPWETWYGELALSSPLSDEPVPTGNSPYVPTRSIIHSISGAA